MPRILDYPGVLSEMQRLGFICTYPNGGSFAFANPAPIRIAGMLAAPDATIRPQMLAHARIMPPPAVESLTRIAMGAVDAARALHGKALRAEPISRATASEPAAPLPAALFNSPSDAAPPQPAGAFRIWLMPASHWGHELRHGNTWLLPILSEMGLGDELLQRTDAAPIQFSDDERPLLQSLISALLSFELSDFTLALPDAPALCLIHHHQQLWWQTPSAPLAAFLDSVQ